MLHLLKNVDKFIQDFLKTKLKQLDLQDITEKTLNRLQKYFTVALKCLHKGQHIGLTWLLDTAQSISAQYR
jgi:hypothetical protein